MPFINIRTAVVAAGLLLAASACNGNGAVPSSALGTGSGLSSAREAVASPADTTSILKLLTKDVVIGSTVDSGNGDTGPRAISVVKTNYDKLKKGDVLVCNFDNASGTAGTGTTVELFNPTPSSKPTTVVQSSKIEGSDGDAVTSGDQVYATGLTSKVMVWINQDGKIKKTYGSPIVDPLGNGDAPPLYLYSPEYIFVGDAQNGDVDNLSLGGYGTGKLLGVITGFDVNKGSGFGALGPSGIAYNSTKEADILYVADGACNAVVAIQHASSLLEKNEITVQPGCKTFKCLHPKTTCATLVKSGSPLNAPVAETLLPNGNLVVANTQGGNTLVEMTPKGQVLDTLTVDKSATAGVFGLQAIGSKDSNTAIFYTDTNTNTLHELEQ
jgi:hypothetical protein